MRYMVIGLMSGSSLDGLDIVFADLNEHSGKWTYQILQAACYSYTQTWVEKLKNAGQLSALEYQLLHTEYGHYIGQQVNEFIDANDLHFKVQLISAHGHTVFHNPAHKMTAQLGDGAAIAAVTGIHVISDLRAMDIALGGQGAPIVPVGERLLLDEFALFLNLGGIANLSVHLSSPLYKYSDAAKENLECVAFDVCPASRVLNMLANLAGKDFDAGGALAATGHLQENLLKELNALEYYGKPYPKSLANEFGIEIIYPMLRSAGCSVADCLRTYVEHICVQIKNALATVMAASNPKGQVWTIEKPMRLLATGGSVFNNFLILRLQELLKDSAIEVVVPDHNLIKYKEALMMGFIGVLRWREEVNVFASVTGATRDSIGGAVWTGQTE